MICKEASINKKRIKLRKRIYDFRETYLALAKTDRFRDDYINTAEVDFRKRYLNDETQKDGQIKRRYIYYVTSDKAWIQSFKDEHRKILRAVKSFDGVLTQEFWLPSILQDVRYTDVKKYKAFSVISGISYKKLNNAQKTKFALLSRKKIKFKSKRRTGMQYRLIVVSNTGKREVISFQDWGVCICETSVKPTMYGRDVENVPIESSRLQVTPHT